MANKIQEIVCTRSCIVKGLVNGERCQINAVMTLDYSKKIKGRFVYLVNDYEVLITKEQILNNFGVRK